MKVHMKNVKWIMVLFFLRAFGDVSCDGVMTVMDDIHIPNIPDPKISRDFPACKKVSSPKCLVACSVPSVARGQLSWYNENVSLSSLTVSDLVTRLYLEVEYHDKNNYSCVVSSSGKTKTSYLDVASSCQSCPKREIPEPASEGDSVILPTNLTEVQYEDHVMWLYENRLIAELFENVSACYDCQDKRFINRLQLDSQTGCLTVTNISKIHTGTIKLLITNGKHQECHRFNVTVYDPLPIPIITKDSTQCSSASKCVLLCSVLNVSDVTLSWYNGSRLNSSINVSDLKSNFLCLEVKYQDRNNYSCVVNNFFTNKTTPLNISEFCKAPWNIPLIVGISVGVVLSIIVLAVVLVYCCWNRFRCQRDASEDQLNVRYASVDVNGYRTAGQNITDNEPEDTHLLDQPTSSSQEFTPVNTLCCK
ncbi:uncharacterized protein LOC130548284 isoform X2 [Triplophysa rosa]|uniref:uncharacterized protein LOC130548284 isoform X2 n=1 Tax=Triplophysa rosa TaxID=992332 RepID=UPI002545D439|nr:uncharacterized protein LOC130548284 isoform X2 [Triplophysa rosa]